MTWTNFFLSIALAVIVSGCIVAHGMVRGYRQDAEEHGGGGGT